MHDIKKRIFYILLFPVATYLSYTFLMETNAGCAVGDSHCVVYSALTWMDLVVIAGLLTAIQVVLLVATLFFRLTEGKGN